MSICLLDGSKGDGYNTEQALHLVSSLVLRMPSVHEAKVTRLLLLARQSGDLSAVKYMAYWSSVVFLRLCDSNQSIGWP
jgi:hypothetical protein